MALNSGSAWPLSVVNVPKTRAAHHVIGVDRAGAAFTHIRHGRVRIDTKQVASAGPDRYRSDHHPGRRVDALRVELCAVGIVAKETRMVRAEAIEPPARRRETETGHIGKADTIRIAERASGRLPTSQRRVRDEDVPECRQRFASTLKIVASMPNGRPMIPLQYAVAAPTAGDSAHCLARRGLPRQATGSLDRADRGPAVIRACERERPFRNETHNETPSTTS